MVFISYWASGYTASDIQRFDNHCESYSALEVVYNAPIAIRYSVTGTSIDRMLNYVIWAAARNACMGLWSRIRTCSGKSFGLLWLLVFRTAEKSWKMSTIQVIF